MREVFFELRLVLERGAVDALELRILFVAFVIGAGHVRELERADVAGAHDVRAGAEIDEFAVAIERDRFALRECSAMMSSLNLLGCRSRTKRAELATLAPWPAPRRAKRRLSRRRDSP